MKIAYFGAGWVEEANLPTLMGGVEVLYFKEKINESNLEEAKEADMVSVFVNSKVSKEVIDAIPNLKFIVTRSMGFDHIDVSYARSKGITVSNVPAYGSYTVAEFTFSLILNLSRKISGANHSIREKASFKYYSEMEGFDLFGKTLGVVGTGKIGKNVVKIGKTFGMKVIASDLHPDLNFAKENDISYKDLPELLAAADIVTLHAPYTKENHHLINKENLAMMKKGVYIINTARGELIDTDALVLGLKEGRIAGAGLDVLEGEKELKEEAEIIGSASGEENGRVKDYKTLLEDHMLMEMPNVIVTPHIAFYTKEAVDEILRVSQDNVEAFVAGKPINLVS